MFDFHGQVLLSTTEWSIFAGFAWFLILDNASVNSGCTQPPPGLLAGDLPKLSVPGVGHLQILCCPWAGYLPTPGPFPSQFPGAAGIDWCIKSKMVAKIATMFGDATGLIKYTSPPKAFHWRHPFEILRHIKNSGKGFHQPPSPLYHGGGTCTCTSEG